MKTRAHFFLLLLLGPSLAACDLHREPKGPDAAVRLDGSLSDAAVTQDAERPDAAPSDAGGPDAGNSCPRAPGPADGERRVVVSRPYDSGGGQVNVWEVLGLSAAGELDRPGVTFEMGRSTLGRVVFTPDGEVGLVAQQDGSLGVFTIDSQGGAQVVHAAFEGAFCATDVVMDPTGDGAWVLDGNWRNNGGGIYRVAIGCDGQLTDLGLVAAAKLPYGLELLPGGAGRAVLAGKDVLDSEADQDAHLLAWGASPSVLASAVAFSDDDDIIGSLAVTP